MAKGIVTYAVGAVVPGLVSPAGFPIRIVLEIDALSTFMAIASVSIALLACVYSMQAMKKHENLDKYFALMLLMVASMLGMVFTGDLFSLFVFLELLSIASAALIAFYSGSGEAAEAAFKYLALSSAAALMVLLAAGFLYAQYDFLNMAALAASVQFSFLDKFALVLLASAFAMKCGAVPLHMWVSDAYGESPAAVSAMLVVASQASLYALFRVAFTLYGGMPLVDLLGLAMVVLGVLSMFVGVTMAIKQADLKRLMAYHAVSQTGYMLLGVGVGLSVLGNSAMIAEFGFRAIQGGLFQVLNHALYKGLLFLSAGAVFYAAGTRDMKKLGGLAHSMPYTTIFFLFGALAIAGMPPFNGFASKLIIYESVFEFNPVLSAIAMIVSLLTLASFVKVFNGVFLGPRNMAAPGAKEVPIGMLAPMAILAALVLLFGLFPNVVLEWLVNPAVNALLAQCGYIGAVV
jgi:multicomponent Na+:H+ antiporter subunit D